MDGTIVLQKHKVNSSRVSESFAECLHGIFDGGVCVGKKTIKITFGLKYK